jgi:hypothetical protein
MVQKRWSLIPIGASLLVVWTAANFDVLADLCRWSAEILWNFLRGISR